MWEERKSGKELGEVEKGVKSVFKKREKGWEEWWGGRRGQSEDEKAV